MPPPLALTFSTQNPTFVWTMVETAGGFSSDSERRRGWMQMSSPPRRFDLGILMVVWVRSYHL
jgi:hypothetical protein